MKISRSTKNKLIATLTVILLILIIILYLIISEERDYKSSMTVSDSDQSSGYSEMEFVNNPFVEKDTTENKKNEEVEKEKQNDEPATVPEIVEEVPAKVVVYENMSLDELAEKINRSLNSDLANKGYLYASYSLERGVDPYLAVAISLEETGCTWNCSYLVKACNNVGGMKGSGCGDYGYFNTLDDGIRAFIDNIARNYVAYGLTTAEAMNPKYAESTSWAYNVNAYIERIRNN